MDPKRIFQTGTSGAAARNADNSERIKSFQTRSSGDVQLDRISIFRENPQTIADSTWTGVNFDYQEFDDANIHTGTTDADLVFNADVAGVWVVMMSAAFDDDTTGTRNMRAVLNGSEQINHSFIRELASSASAAGGSIIQSTFMFTFNEGDEVTIEVSQYSGGSLDLLRASLQAFRIGV